MSVLDIQSLPAALDAERAILGAMLNDDMALDDLRELPPEAFSLDSHRRIVAVAGAMRDEGLSVDLVTLTERLSARGELPSVGGAAYVCSLTDGAMRRANVAAHLSLVREAWLRRSLIATCAKYAERAADRSEHSAHDLIAAADKEILTISAESQSGQQSIEAQSLAEMDRLEEQRKGSAMLGYDFGVGALDRMLPGVVPQELTVLAARPAQGKSALAAQLIVRHCRRGVPVHVFSIEMSAGQLLRRLWAIVGAVPFHKLRHPQRLTAEEHERTMAAMEAVAAWPLTIDESCSLSIAQLVARARIAKRRQGSRIAIVDYLQKLRFAGKPEHRYLAVTDAAQQLARLAKEENIAVLLLSSLTEKSGKGRNDAPSLSDIRQSGDVQYEAHCVLLLHRRIDEETEKPETDGEIIVAKARSDESGCVRVRFNSERLCFEDAASHR